MLLLRARSRSRSAKLKKKRGRPRLPANGHDREPNGQLCRRKNGVESRVMDTCLNARIRHLGLIDIEAAKDPRRGYVLGRLLLADQVNEPQHEAGLRYAADLARWFALCVGRFPSVRAQNLFSCPGRPPSAKGRPRRPPARRSVGALHTALRAAGEASVAAGWSMSCETCACSTGPSGWSRWSC
jgi:hypothetical protein